MNFLWVGEMTYVTNGRSGLDYLPCRYGRSRLQFRGPKRRLVGEYALFIGGTETYGRFVEKPYPVLIEQATGARCINFGLQNAGVDAFLNDPTVMDAAQKARVTVVQVMGAQNMSNRFYSVHPRRNDRFLHASAMMKQLVRDVDFVEFSFNRHMLSAVRGLSQERFQIIRAELQEAWLGRMRHLLKGIGGRTILLWFAGHTPDDASKGKSVQGGADGLGDDPLFIDRAMIEALRPLVTSVVEVNLSSDALSRGTEGMVFDAMQAPIAAGMLGPLAHQEAAAALVPDLVRLMGKRQD
ncbi:MAG: DUF6473 family protein [Paracoccaceae bacterium]